MKTNWYAIWIPFIRCDNPRPWGPQVTSNIGNQFLAVEACAAPPTASCTNPDILKPQRFIRDGYASPPQAVDRREIHPQRIALFDTREKALAEARRPCWMMDGKVCQSAKGLRSACQSCPPLQTRCYRGPLPDFRMYSQAVVLPPRQEK